MIITVTNCSPSLELTADRMGHRSGFGPIAVAEKIEQQFGELPVIKQEKLVLLFLNMTGSAPCTQGIWAERIRQKFSKIVWNVCLGETTQEVGLDIKQIREECQELMLSRQSYINLIFLSYSDMLVWILDLKRSRLRLTPSNLQSCCRPVIRFSRNFY